MAYMPHLLLCITATSLLVPGCYCSPIKETADNTSNVVNGKEMASTTTEMGNSLQTQMQSRNQSLQRQQLIQDEMVTSSPQTRQDALETPDHSSILPANEPIEVIVVEDLTSPALSAIPQIMDSQEKILNLLHNQTTILTAVLENVANLLQSQPDMKSASLPTPQPPRDCKDILEDRFSVSKTYTIKPWREMESYTVYCDMETDGGGWTLFQRRFNGSVDFYRGWEDYAQGFGDLDGEHWAGLELVNQLTRGGSSDLRIDVEDIYGNAAYAKYSNFRIGNAASSYRLSYDNYVGGEAENGLQNNMPFTTKDNDLDRESSLNCADVCHGAWWYYKCSYGIPPNLNGQFGPADDQLKEMNWKAWRYTDVLRLRKSSMMIRRH